MEDPKKFTDKTNILFQVQYTDKIKGIVEFLGVRLDLEELTRMWSLQVRCTPFYFLCQGKVATSLVRQSPMAFLLFPEERN